MRILLEESLCLVIDIQEKLVPAMQNGEAMITQTRRLLQGLATLGLPLMLTEQYPQGLGSTISAIKELLPQTTALAKTSFSCCDDPAFLAELRACDRSTVIVCGMESHVCVQQTVIDLSALGFQPVVVADCVASRKDFDRQLSLQRMEREGAIIASLESLLFELTRAAGTDTFKAISRLVK